MKEEINTMPKTSLYNMGRRGHWRSGAERGALCRSHQHRRYGIWSSAPFWQTSRQGTQSALTRARSAAAAARSTARRAPATRVTMATVLRSSVTAASSLRPSPATMSSTCPRRSRRLAFKSAMTSKLNAGEIIVVDEIKARRAQDQAHGQGAGQLRPQGLDHAGAARPRRDPPCAPPATSKSSDLPTSTPSTCTIS